MVRYVRTAGIALMLAMADVSFRAPFDPRKQLPAIVREMSLPAGLHDEREMVGGRFVLTLDDPGPRSGDFRHFGLN